MNTMTALALIALAALIHASFQLSVSMVTLLTSHALGSRAKQMKIVRLTNSFSFGATVMTLLLLAGTSYICSRFFPITTPLLMWAIVCGAVFGVGVAVWMFYYRREAGTALWIPRSMSRYLMRRAKVTNMSGEAFGLGLSSVLAEIVFIFAPILVASLTIIRMAPAWQLVGLATYTIISMLSLLTVTALIGGGERLSRIQRWREANKKFLQFAAGSGLIILGFSIYVNQILSVHVMALTGAIH
ncbi:MAG TPA: hypothetical protein VFQ70_00095 [Candidatus Saccharimonadaceae bacterium]|nr:hypothetical protein [Candidatus Saccharimonadaceae bacterium]